MKTPITTPGQTAGQTPRATAASIGSSTRLQASGNSRNMLERLTGISVPSATPASPSGRTMATLSATLQSAVLMLAAETMRWDPAPLRSVIPVALPTRMMTTTDSICRTSTLPSKSGPTHAVTSGRASSSIAPDSGTTVASDSFVPSMKMRCRRSSRRRGVVLDDGGEEDVVELIGQALRQLGEPLRDRPDGDGGGVDERADHQRVDRVVQLVGPVDHRHVNAEAGHLPEPSTPEQRSADAQPGKDAIGIGAVDPQREHPDGRHGDDQLHQSVAGQQHDDVDDRRRDAARRCRRGCSGRSAGSR